MAHQIQVKTLSHTWNVNTHIKNIIGKGAHGIIYRGTDGKGNPIAAKSINGADHSKILTRDLDKLLELDHPNIIKIFDIHRQGETFWMFMELCSMGDLHKFFKSRDLNEKQLLEIMIQIARGLEYLHKHDIVHRDIKPANILVADEFPLNVKMTDFDVSKFFDPDIETSVMSSNVGTLVYKAPEFFQRGEDGKLYYHKSVDIYSLALTYLPMVQKRKSLIPHIETAEDESELHNSIGSTIANRIKYGIKPVDIVVIDNHDTGADKASFENDIKKLIKKMTCVQPRDRVSIVEVLHILETKIICGDMDVQRGIRLDKINNWAPGLCGISIFVNNKKNIILRGKIDKKGEFFRIMDKSTGSIARDIKSLCNHGRGCFINEHPVDPNCLLEICRECKVIRSYNVFTGEGHSVYGTCVPVKICPGPAGSLLVVDANRHILQLKWEETAKAFTLVQILTSHVEEVKITGMCYIEKGDLLIMTSVSPGSIKAIKLDGSVLWKVSGKVAGLKIDPWGVCSDQHGYIYIADRSNSRLLLLASSSGEVLQVIPMEAEMESIWNVCLSVIEPHVIVLHKDLGAMITCFNVKGD